MTRSTVAGAAALLLLSACAHRLAAGPAPAGQEEAMARCPMSVAGTSLSAADAPRGEALIFTSPAQVGALQDRVQAMAELLNQRQRHGQPGAIMAKAAWSKRTTPWSGAALPPSYATVHEVERGAVLTITSDAPDDIEQLRYAVRVRAWDLKQRGCAAAALGASGG